MDIVTEVRRAFSEASEMPVEKMDVDIPMESLGLTSVHLLTAYVCLERSLDISFTGDDLALAPSDTMADVASAIEAIRAAR